MDWSEERYVRVYVRDTTTWKLLRWQGQTVFLHVLRKLNRVGQLDLAGCTPAEAVELHTDLPREVVEVGLQACLDRGVLAVTKRDAGGTLVCPNYVEAQEAKASAALRKREQRARDRDKADAGVTKRDTDVPYTDARVTRGHTESHDVTPSLAMPSRTPQPPTGGGVESGPERMARAYADATGNRDLRPDGQWTPQQQRALLDASAHAGGEYAVAHAEFRRLKSANAWLAGQPVHTWVARWGTGGATADDPTTQAIAAQWTKRPEVRT